MDYHRQTLLKNHKRFFHDNLYWNFRLGGLQSALGLSQLNNLNSVILSKIKQGKRYTYLFNKYNIKPVLGVIPKNKDPKLLNFPKDKNFWTKIKNWQNNGWEISLHGYSHDYDVETHKKDFFKLEFISNKFLLKSKQLITPTSVIIPVNIDLAFSIKNFHYIIFDI